MRCCISAMVSLSIVLGTAVSAEAQVLGKTTTGKPPVKSIQSIRFAEHGVLLVGDGAGSQIFAIDTGDKSERGRLGKTIGRFAEKLAGRLGTTADGIEIIDLAVNPASGTAYFAVRKQDEKAYLILTVDGRGAIAEFPLDEVKYARAQLDAGKVNISAVTDVAWADDRIVAAGRGNETFASKIFSIPGPVSHDSVGSVYSAETYHVSHGRWETKAPMSVLIPFRQHDRSYVVGAFSCTPVVKYPIDALEPGAKVKGLSVLELGSGNRPIDMFVYRKGDKPFVLANTFRFHHQRKPFGPSPYWTVKFEQGVLNEDTKVNEKALRRLKKYEAATPKVEMVESYHGVMQMDQLDDEHALVLRQTDDGIRLEPLALP